MAKNDEKNKEKRPKSKKKKKYFPQVVPPFPARLTDLISGVWAQKKKRVFYGDSSVGRSVARTDGGKKSPTQSYGPVEL